MNRKALKQLILNELNDALLECDTHDQIAEKLTNAVLLCYHLQRVNPLAEDISWATRT